MIVYNVNVVNIIYGENLLSIRPDVLFSAAFQVLLNFSVVNFGRKLKFFVETKRFSSLDTNAILDAIFVYPTEREEGRLGR